MTLATRTGKHIAVVQWLGYPSPLIKGEKETSASLGTLGDPGSNPGMATFISLNPLHLYSGILHGMLRIETSREAYHHGSTHSDG